MKKLRAREKRCLDQAGLASCCPLHYHPSYCAGKGVWVGVKTPRFEDIQSQPHSLCRAALDIQVCMTEICSQILYHWELPLFITYFYFMFISMHVCLCDGVRSPGVTERCELSCGCWNRTWVLWKWMKQVLLTTESDLSSPPHPSRGSQILNVSL